MIITPENPKNYCIVCNEVAKRKDLSARAKGIYYYLATLPVSWQLQQQEAESHFTEGREAFKTAFKELVEKGYIKPIKTKDEKGRLTGWRYSVLWSSDIPENTETDTPENRNRKNRQTENRHIENPQLLNTNKLSTDLFNTDLINNNTLTSIIEKPEKPSKFKIPNQQEIKDYFFELGFAGIEADKYFDYYSANGWMVGKSKMRDWRAAVRNWTRNVKTTEPDKKEYEYQKEGQSYNGLL
jgi:hypothetical protein